MITKTHVKFQLNRISTSKKMWNRQTTVAFYKIGLALITKNFGQQGLVRNKKRPKILVINVVTKLLTLFS